MSDVLISKQVVLDAIRRISLGQTDAVKVSMMTEEYVKSLPPVNPWIPVSVRLPKENGWYQCTIQVLDVVRTMELYYKYGKWIDNRRVNMFDTYDIYGYGMTTEKHKLSYEELKPQFDWTNNVIAWKPLSEPYRAESEEV